MLDILYTLFIFPIEQIIELSYVFGFRIFQSLALSILGVSAAVSVLTLPLYFMAEKHQRSEQNIQKKMKPEVENIKAVFSGDERFMRLSAYYRQKRYHPLYSLRSSISLIIQIPFFIAAYHFLSNLELLKGVSFGPIADLAKPDSLVAVRNFQINILPVAMTLINGVSAFIYSKGFSKKEKIQLYGMAAVFLVLLYNSSSALVLYWTGNNIFSLVKNGIQKTKHPKKIAFVMVTLFCFLLDIFLLFFHKGTISKRLCLFFILTVIPFLPLLYKLFNRIKSPLPPPPYHHQRVFILSLIILFLLGGLVIPSSLIASSVQEFSFIDNYTSPFPFILNTILQSAGIFLIWPLCIYSIFPQNIKRKLAILAAVVAVVAILNVYLFPGKYGSLSLTFTFSEDVASNIAGILLNVLAILAGAAFALLLIYRFRRVTMPILAITACTLGLMGVINSVNISKDYKAFEIQLTRDRVAAGKPVYQFSQNGKNVLVIMLDRAISGYIPYIFNEKQELYGSFDGFTWYKNTVSFGGYTNFGTPGLFGGYEYTPLAMQARKTVSLVQKHNEALLLLPKIFLDQGFNVTVTDPPYANYSSVADLSIFNDYPQINAENIGDKYNRQWILNNKNVHQLNLAKVIKLDLIRFSFFKFAPVPLRKFIYDSGGWWMLNDEKGRIPNSTLSDYIALDVLPDITVVSDTRLNTYNALTNELTHDPYFLHAPDYSLSSESTNKGDGPFADESHYHVNIAALLLLGKWFDFLRENNVYDNTRIIIVSDHGGDLFSKFPDNIVLPSGNCLEYYNALLMVKDFDAHGALTINDSFMTNADVPLIALEGIVENPINPWTGKILESDKSNGVYITTSSLWSVTTHHKYQFKIKPDQWLHVHDNIFDPENWSKARR